MKAVFVLGFACIIASALAAPAPAVTAKLEEIRTVVRDALDKIEAAAIADNPELGEKIKEKLEAVAGKAAALLKRAREIANPTLIQARESIKEFLTLMGEAKEAAKEDVKQLSEPAQKEIKEIFTTSLAKAKEIVHEARTEAEAATEAQ